MDPLDLFAAEALRFETWATSPGSTDEQAATREALIRLTSLYLAGLQLPPAWSDGLLNQPDAESISVRECDRVIAHRSIPFDHHYSVFNPTIVPPDAEPSIHSVCDDFRDIYSDVITGLRAYQCGQRAQANWEWGTGFTLHWGDHATSAIHSLHAWLRSNENRIS
ncbi:MAG: DUF5063 domain-containing protein [Planctomycetales bacterium]